MATDVDDQRRVAAITAYDAVRMPPRELDDVVALAARLAGVAKATINIITDVEQHQVVDRRLRAGGVRARGLDVQRRAARRRAGRRTGRGARTPRFAQNPFVTGEIADVRFYASFPLYSQDGIPFGTPVRLRRGGRAS